MGRYKKININNFSGGIGNEFCQGENNFYISQNINVKNDTKKIKLLGNLIGTDIPSSPGEDSIAPYRFSKKSNSILLLVSDDENELTYLYESFDGINFSKINTFSETIGVDECKIFSNNNIVVCFFAFGYIAVSYDGGYNFTEHVNSFYPTGNLVFGDKIAYVTDQYLDYTLLKTTDFLNYDVVFNFTDTGDEIRNLIFVNDIFYFSVDNRLYRIENNIPILIRTFSALTDLYLSCVGNNLVIAYFINYSKIRIVFYDVDQFSVVKELNLSDNFHYIKFLFSIEKETYFVIRQNSETPKEEIYKLTDDGSIFKMFSFNHSKSSYTDGGQKIGDDYFFAVVTQDLPYNYKIYKNTIYSLSGNLETSIFEAGEIVPKQLIVRHKPLLTGTSVKIYHKFNHSSSYTLDITSNVEGAVKAKYNFPTGTICDFYQFKIELLTSDSSKTPDDVELEFLYLPIGLENSK